MPVFLVSSSARRLSSTGAYVSGTMKDARIHSTPAKTASRPCTQRQPSFSPKKPPTIGPIAGPRQGAREKMVMARPRSWAEKMSDMTPPAFVKGEDPKEPAKNLKTRRLPMLLTPAQPARKAVNNAKVEKKTYWRPIVSLSGAQTRGPSANPSTKRETPAVISSVEAWRP